MHVGSPGVERPTGEVFRQRGQRHDLGVVQGDQVFAEFQSQRQPRVFKDHRLDALRRDGSRALFQHANGGGEQAMLERDPSIGLEHEPEATQPGLVDEAVIKRDLIGCMADRRAHLVIHKQAMAEGDALDAVGLHEGIPIARP